MSQRDYIGEMNGLIEAATDGGDWIAPVVAAKLRASLAETDQELLDGWLQCMAERMLTDVIGARARQLRSTARARASARAFGDAAESGDPRRLGMFMVTHVVNAEGLHKRAADMTGPDHLFVAEHTYQRSANVALMYAAFHRRVAARVGKSRTADVYTEQQYEAMFASITRAPGTAVA